MGDLCERISSKRLIIVGIFYFAGGYTGHCLDDFLCSFDAAGIRYHLNGKGLCAESGARIKICSELFGKFERIMSYGTLILYGIGAAGIYFFPKQMWFGLCLMIAAPMYYL